MLRQVDTRLFCPIAPGAPGGQYVLRDWTLREATYEELRLRGVDLSPTSAHISQDSMGTALLGERDLKRRCRHKLLIT